MRFSFIEKTVNNYLEIRNFQKLCKIEFNDFFENFSFLVLTFLCFFCYNSFEK